LRYNLEPAGVLAQAKYRLGTSAFFAGVRYAYAQTDVTFAAPAATPGLPDFRRTSRVGGLSPMFTLDSRDNLFTPTRGSYVEGTASFFSDLFGSDDTFQTFDAVGIHYVTLPSQVYLGMRGEFASSSTDTPFYVRPFIYQRGVPAMRYLGEEMAQVEGEVRWQFWKRFSAVGFAGTGAAWTGFARVDNPSTATAGGGGFRYELARRYGMHAGLDIAYGPDGTTYYIQWGSAWARP
jgi:outer membrane translocation and assembly module TamA